MSAVRIGEVFLAARLGLRSMCNMGLRRVVEHACYADQIEPFFEVHLRHACVCVQPNRLKCSCRPIAATPDVHHTSSQNHVERHFLVQAQSRTPPLVVSWTAWEHYGLGCPP
eukprot:1260458-Amphidinium_carterae.1